MGRPPAPAARSTSAQTDCLGSKGGDPPTSKGTNATHGPARGGTTSGTLHPIRPNAGHPCHVTANLPSPAAAEQPVSQQSHSQYALAVSLLAALPVLDVESGKLLKHKEL